MIRCRFLDNQVIRHSWLGFVVGVSTLFATFSPACDRGKVPDNASVTVPFSMNGGHIVLEVTINDRKLGLTLDTGNVKAPTILYGSPKIDALDLNYKGVAQVGGAGDGEMAAAKVAPSVTLGLPGKVIPPQSVIVMAYDPALLKAFEGEDGVIGAAVWERFVVSIDFLRKVIVLTEPDGFVYKGPGREFLLGSLPDGGSTVNGTVTLLNGREIPALLHLDLGSPVALSLNLGSRPEITKPEKTVERRAFGSQGEFIEHIGRIRELRLGDFALEDVLTSFTSTPSLSSMGNEGDIGSEVFQRFKVTFDYRNSRLYLEPNDRFADPFRFDMSGLGLRRTDEGEYGIARILPDSPASEAGLEVGDVIQEIDGRPSRSIGRDEARRMLMEEGRTLSLTVVRDGQMKIVSIQLRKLI